MLKRILTIALVVLMLAAVCVGCTQQAVDAPAAETEAAAEPAGETEAPAEAPAESAEPKTLTVAFDAEPAHIDSAAVAPYLTWWVSNPINDFLVRLDDSGENIVPSLAKEYEFLSDTEFRFVLQDNAMFHDGSPVTVKDVAYTLTSYVQQAEVGCAYATNLACITSIEEVSEKEGIMHFSEPLAPLLDYLTWIPIYKDGADVATQKSAPIGCGPFKFVEWAADQYVEYEKFADYWDADAIQLDGMVMRFFSDYNSAKTAFLAGEVNILYWVEGADMPSFEASPDYYLFSAPYGSYYVNMVVTDEHFSDLNVRQAVKHAINKEQAVATVLSGNGEPSVVALQKSSAYYSTDWEYEYSVDKAKEYMAASAFPDGFNATIITPNTATEGPLAEVVAANLKEIGINLEVNKMELTSFFEPFSTARNYEMAICGYITGTDPDNPMYNHMSIDTNSNGYDNPEVMALMQEARTTFDVAKRTELYKQAIQTFIDEAPTVFVFNEYRTAALASNVNGLVMWPARYCWNKVTID